MKKYTAIILALVLSLSVFFTSASAQAEDTRYTVSASDGTVMFAKPDINSEYLALLPFGTVITVTAADENWLYTSYSGFRGWITADSVTVFQSPEPPLSNVTSIIITRPANTTVFYEDGEFNSDALEVSAVLSDGTEKVITGYTVSAPSLSSPGEKTVIIRWYSFSVSYTVTVNQLPIAGIEIISTPDKLTYKQGERLDTTGLKVRALFSDGTEPCEVTGYSVTGFDSGTAGKQTITVTYKSIHTATFEVSVEEKKLIGLELTSEPSVRIYYGTDFTVNTGGLILTAFYDNNTSNAVEPESAVCNSRLYGMSDVILSYGGMSVTYKIIIREISATGIEIKPPAKTQYKLGEAADFSGIAIYIVYNNGEKKLTEDYQMADTIDTSTEGIKIITVTCGEFTASFEVRVGEKRLLGDVDGNGKVNAADARHLLRMAAGLEIFTDDMLEYCDVNEDGKIRASDARIVLRYAAGLIY